MNTIFHPSQERGHANHGWLTSHHSFSFANYYNPDKIHFGALRVLNDDRIKGGTGFGKHPHENMEIISIPLSGKLKHEDSMGNNGVITSGEVQVMSAGTGIVHSEMNASDTTDCSFLQIWIIPNEQNVVPRYGQQKITTLPDDWNQIVGSKEELDELWIHQDARMYLLTSVDKLNHSYKLKGSNHGVYFFVLEGTVEIEGTDLRKRDALGVWETDEIQLNTQKGSKILAIEVPMS